MTLSAKLVSAFFTLALVTTSALPLLTMSGEVPSRPHEPMLGFKPQNEQIERALEAKFDVLIRPDDLRNWLQQMSSAPNQVGSPHDKANADFTLAKFKEWGWDAHIETFYILYPTPKNELVEMIGPDRHSVALTEGPVAGDRTSTQEAGELPAYNAYGGDGDVTGDLVYANYGMADDYKVLARNGISAKGRIVVARYGEGWRGLKPKLAYEHGAIGCIIYSDPADDGYSTDEPYPKGGARPAQGIQRGSVIDNSVRAGDPLTPNIGARRDAKRIPLEQAETILKIPVLPISYGDAQVLLRAMTGPVAPQSWRGGLPITYHLGPGATRVHMVVQSNWTLKPIYDVIAIIRGSEYPDEWIIRGNHHDGWVFGAWDPLAGNVGLMAEAQAIGKLHKEGWRPKRTLVYASWDGEEPMVMGSTEWVEEHTDELTRKAALYVNSDTNGRGFLGVGGSPALQHFVNQVAADLIDPETGASVLERMRARVQVQAFDHPPPPEQRFALEMAAKGGDMPIGALGSGSDFTAFLDHLGIATLDSAYGGEDIDAGIYHSAYDSFDHYIRFGDPTFAYGVMLAKTDGRMMLRAADADVLPYRFSDFAITMARYVGELHKLVDNERTHAETLDRLLKTNAFEIAADPSKTTVPPATESAVPASLDLSRLDGAVERLKKSAAAYDAAYSGMADAPRRSLTQVNAVLTGISSALLNPPGLPGRSWYKNLIYAPGLLTGYEAKTLPGVREAIEARRWDEANEYANHTATALDAYAARIDTATNVLHDAAH